MTGWHVVCDAGGTNIRFARTNGPNQLSDVHVEATRACGSLPESLERYCLQFDDRAGLLGAAIAAAGPADIQSIRLTNSPLIINRGEISAQIGGKPVTLFNDLEATAYALPVLTAADLRPIVAAPDPIRGPRLVVNVGTGFGAALLIDTPAGYQALATEAGHMTLDPRPGVTGVTSVEEQLSGAALGSSVDGRLPPGFGELLGLVCGNLVLATGAWGGVYLCGSVASAWCRTGDLPKFAAAFHAKGRMSDRMQRIPVHEITAPHPALIGLTTIWTARR